MPFPASTFKKQSSSLDGHLTGPQADDQLKSNPSATPVSSGDFLLKLLESSLRILGTEWMPLFLPLHFEPRWHEQVGQLPHYT